MSSGRWTEALSEEGGLAILRGNICPDGAVIKQSAASPDLLQHRGKAYVFENHEDMEAQVDQDYLPIDRNSILVMKNGGPKGRARISGMGLDSYAQDAASARDQRRRPHLRFANERNQLRNGGSPCAPGIGNRWTAQPGRDRG